MTSGGAKAATPSRIRAQWGLLVHTCHGAKALVAATNLPDPAVDLDEVLSYTPVTTLTQHCRTPAEIATELAAALKLDALLQQAQDLGFTFYGTALRETYNVGGELPTLVLLDRGRIDLAVFVRRASDRPTILHSTSACATECNDAGGWWYDLAAREWSFWREWAAAASTASAGKPMACPAKTKTAFLE